MCIQGDRKNWVKLDIKRVFFTILYNIIVIAIRTISASSRTRKRRRVAWFEYKIILYYYACFYESLMYRYFKITVLLWWHDVMLIIILCSRNNGDIFKTYLILTIFVTWNFDRILLAYIYIVSIQLVPQILNETVLYYIAVIRLKIA